MSIEQLSEDLARTREEIERQYGIIRAQEEELARFGSENQALKKQLLRVAVRLRQESDALLGRPSASPASRPGEGW